jgi:hypothetical protein
MGLQQVLSYLYTNRIVVNIRNIDSILTCANELDISHLKTHCKSMFADFDKKHVFQAIEIARKHNLGVPYFEAYWHICLNFDECVQFSGFLSAKYWLVVDILSEKLVKRRDESLLLERLLRYIVHNRETLEKNPLSIPSLLDKIKFSKIGLDDLNRLLEENNFILSMKGCQSIFSRALK